MIKASSIKTLNKRVEEKHSFNHDPSDGVNIRTNINTSKGYIEYGAKDSFPNYLLSVVNKSHTANSCIATRSVFLEGKLQSESLRDLVVNQYGDTFGDIHHKVCLDYGMFEGAYIHLSYNLKGEVTRIQHLPFEYCRLGAPNEFGRVTYIRYNPYFGTQDYKEEEDEQFPVFNPSLDVVSAQMKEAGFNGQVFFVKEERPNSRFYPVPFYWSGHYWFDVERKIGEFHNANIDNNFLLSVLIKFVGDPDQAVERNDNGEVTKTIKQVIDSQLEERYSGKDKGGVVMTLWGDSKESFPEIEAFPTNTNDGLFTALQELIYENVTIATNTPPSLANIQVSGKLGNTQEIENSVKLQQGRVQPSQTKLESTYDKIFKSSNFGEQDTTILPFEYGEKNTSTTKENDTTKTTEENNVIQDDIEKKQASYNGAQIASALEIVSQVSLGSLTEDQGVKMLVEFLQIDPIIAAQLVKK